MPETFGEYRGSWPRWLSLGIPLWIVIVYQILFCLNPQMEQANINMNSNLNRFLQLLIVTPHTHKVHHSRDQKETDSNYSNIFSFWDSVWGSFTAEIDFQKLRYWTRRL